jgi:membrane protease subunit HflK
VQEAQGFRESQVARARGEGQRFISVLAAYQAAQDVTLRRIYIETMEDILRRNPKVVVDDRLQGIVPLLNLGDAGRGVAASQGAPRPQPPQPPQQFQSQPSTAFPPTRPQGAIR